MSSDDRIFKALADRRRRKILDLLKNQPLTTGDLVKRFLSIDRCTVMLHLRVLEKAGLIIVKREGRLRWNYLNPLPVKEIYDRWISVHAAAAVDFLSAMTRDLER